MGPMKLAGLGDKAISREPIHIIIKDCNKMQEENKHNCVIENSERASSHKVF